MNRVVLYVFLLAVVAWLSTIVQAQFIDDSPDSPYGSAPAAPKASDGSFLWTRTIPATI